MCGPYEPGPALCPHRECLSLPPVKLHIFLLFLLILLLREGRGRVFGCVRHDARGTRALYVTCSALRGLSGPYTHMRLQDVRFFLCPCVLWCFVLDNRTHKFDNQAVLFFKISER